MTFWCLGSSNFNHLFGKLKVWFIIIRVYTLGDCCLTFPNKSRLRKELHSADIIGIYIFNDVFCFAPFLLLPNVGINDLCSLIIFISH